MLSSLLALWIIILKSQIRICQLEVVSFFPSSSCLFFEIVVFIPLYFFANAQFFPLLCLESTINGGYHRDISSITFVGLAECSIVAYYR